MACKPSPDETEESLLACSICYISYEVNNISDHRPCLLRCGHTFCEKCVDRCIDYDSVKCPTCRKTTPRPSSSYDKKWAKGLPSNYAVIQLLENDGGKEKNKITVPCGSHGDKQVEYFCEYHSAKCCSGCAFDSHRECRNVIKLEDFVNGLKNRKENIFNMADMQNTIESVVISLEDRSARVNRQADDIKTKVQDVRTAVVKKMDEIVSRVSDTCDVVKKEYEQEVTRSKNLSEEIAMSRKSFTVRFGKESDAEIFNAYTEAKKHSEDFEQRVNEMLKRSTDQSNLASVGLKLELHDSITDVINTAGYSSRVNVTKTYHNSMVELEVQVEKNEIKLSGHLNEPPDISGIVHFENGDIVLADNANRTLYAVKSSFRGRPEVTPLPGPPLGLAVVKGKEVAVALWCCNKLAMVSFDETPEVQRTFSFEKQPYHLAPISESELVVGWLDAGVGVISLDDGDEKIYMDRDNTGREIKIEVHDYLSVNVSRSRFYHSSFYNFVIFSFDFNGKHVFTYPHERFGKSSGMALDRDGNICVCIGENGSVHQISPEGVWMRTINVGLKKPYIMSFNNSGEQMIVVDKSVTSNTHLKLSVVSFGQGK